MQFTPKTDKELQEMNLWPNGIYSFEVIEKVTLGSNTFHTEDKTSKSGNEMIQLVLQVYNESGKFITVIDYLLESMAYKLKHSAQACGLEDDYNKGQLHASSYIGRTGFLELSIQKDKSGNYPDKNAVRDYVKPEDSAHLQPVKSASEELNDEVPF